MITGALYKRPVLYKIWPLKNIWSLNGSLDGFQRHGRWVGFWCTVTGLVSEAWLLTLLNFCTKCEGKFVPDSPTNNVATEHVQCTAAAGLGWWENRISSRLCQPIRGKLWFWKLCVNQWQCACGSMPLVGQLRVTFFKKCGQYTTTVLNWKSS